jgi:hypothetical protein
LCDDIDRGGSSESRGNLSGQQLFILSGVRWNFTWQRHHSFARAASKSGYEVVFVLPTPRSLRQIVAHVSRKFQRVRGDGIPHPLPVGVQVTTLHALLLQLAVRKAQRLVRRLSNDGIQDALVICYVPSLWLPFVIRLISPEFVVYDNVVMWSKAPLSFYPPRWSHRVEEWLARQPDVQFASDSELVSSSWEKRGISCRTVLPAVDEEFLAHHWGWREAPSEIRTVGYFGAVVASEIDINLLSYHRKLGRTVHVVGPVSQDVATRLVTLGIDVQRPVALTELVHIVESWDAILLPYRADLSRGGAVTPAKLLNSLATGKTVLLSGIPLPSEISDQCHIDEVDEGQVALRWRNLDDLPTWRTRLDELLFGTRVEKTE